MSNMENLESKLTEAERQSVVYEQAMASIAHKRHMAPRDGHAVMAAFMSYGESASEGPVMSKAAHGAKLFCILFAMLAPSLLIWQVML